MQATSRLDVSPPTLAVSNNTVGATGSEWSTSVSRHVVNTKTTEVLDLFDEDVLDALSECGMILYREKIQPVVEPEQNGKHIVVPLGTGDYAVAANGPDAWQAMRAHQ